MANQYDRTMELFGLSESIWRKDLTFSAPQDACADTHAEPKVAIDHALAKQAARSACKKSNTKARSGLVVEPALVPRLLSKCVFEDWLASDEVHGNTNAEQHAFLKLVVDRILVEHGLKSAAECTRASPDPLVWLLHGKPGTGKSHVINKLKSLFALCGYQQGLQYEVLAFQNTNAAQIHGATLHSACGMNWNKDFSADASKRMATWRWVIIDEISLVSAYLLADMERRLQAAVPEVSAHKLGQDGRSRPFAGVNIIFAGDFEQLPPPEGGYLADVPQYFKDATADKKQLPPVEYGQSLFWDGAVQGVTELTEIMRCKDDWWNEVVQQLRSGFLSNDNHKYLHGHRVEGCHLSAEERRSRQRIIDGPADPRLREPKFQHAPVIVANNDAKYQISKDRAEWFCSDAGIQRPRWAVALDSASSKALQADTCDKEAKLRRLVFTSNFSRFVLIGEGHGGYCFEAAATAHCDFSIWPRWLRCHDKDTGELPGLLPLAIGMPVALSAFHIDKARGLFKARGGGLKNYRDPVNIHVKLNHKSAMLKQKPCPPKKLTKLCAPGHCWEGLFVGMAPKQQNAGRGLCEVRWSGVVLGGHG